MLKEIRIAKEKDCPKMLELLEYICNLHSGIRPDLFKAGKSKYDSESLAKLLADENRLTFVAADENDEVLGYIFCILIDHSVDSARCPNKELYIDDLCVDEKCRHEGIGDALFKKALETAKDLGCHDLTLNVWEGNDGALRFYEKHGMKIQKREMEIVLD